MRAQNEIIKQYRIAVIDTFSRFTEIVSLHHFKKQVSEPIASSLGKYVCWDKNVALSHKIGPILLLHRCRKILVWFFLSLHRWQKFWRTKLYRFIRFFSQKLCICIALNDTFLSIAAHHWSADTHPQEVYTDNFGIFLWGLASQWSLPFSMSPAIMSTVWRKNK